MMDWSRLLNPTVRFYTLDHLFTKVQPRNGLRLEGVEPLWSIYEAKVENEYPPLLIFDGERRVRLKDRVLCLAPISEPDEIIEYTVGLSPTAYKKLINVIKEHGVYIEDDDEPPLDKLLASSGICYRPVSRIRDIYAIEGMEWEPFVERLIRWDAEEKDPRLCLVHKAMLLRGIEPRLNAHALICTNAGTGKSIHYNVHGLLIDKATRNAFLGFAKSPKEVFKGTVEGEALPIGVDQIEVGAWGIMDYMFNIMEYGEAMVSSGAAKFPVRSRSPFAFMANPLTDKVNAQKSFGILMDHLSRNPAIGRRFGVLVYGTDYAIIKTRSTPGSIDQWKQQAAFFRAVEEAALPELKAIMGSQEIWDWINREIPGYAERMERIAKGCNDDTLQVFFTEHGRAGQGRVRAAALQVSLVDYLKDIALGRYSLQEMISHAEELLHSFTALNLESALNIVANIHDEKRFMAEHWLDMAPGYLKEIVYAVEYARRSGVLGNIFYLGDIDYKPTEYSHISKCIYKLLNKKRGQVEINQRCREYFGFSFQPQGTQLQIILENKSPMKWLNIPGCEEPEATDGPLDAALSGETEEKNEEAGALASDMKVLREALRSLESETGEAVPRSALVEAVKYRHWMPQHFDKVLDVLMCDGTVYSPRPGFYRVVK